MPSSIKVRWPDWLTNPDTRASHIAIAVVTAIILVLALILLPWAVYRCGGSAVCSTAPPDPTARYLGSRAPTHTFTSIANQLVDPTSIGTHWITNGQSILSPDARFELGLTNDGNLEFYDHQQDKLCWQSGTVNTGSPGQRCIVGMEGVVYIIRNDGSRVTISGTQEFWQSDNQVQSYWRNPNTGATFYVDKPFILGFYSDGLVLYSNDSRNKKNLNLNNARVNLWWICVSGVQPPNCPASCSSLRPCLCT